MENKTTETITYDASSALVLATSAQKALANATDYVIDSPTMYELAGEDLKRVKALQKEVEDKRTSITGPLNAAVKAVNDLFRAPKESLEQAEIKLKRAIGVWLTEQERQAAEARRKAEEEARAERERLAQQEREAQEAAAKAEREAQELQAAGDNEGAAKAIERAAAERQTVEIAQITASVVTVTPVVEAPAKVSGISGRVSYVAEVTDLMTLVKAVAAGQAPIECLQADTKFIGAQARAFKKSGQLFPGVVAREERTISARSA